MSNKLLDYLVKEASLGEVGRGLISPVWMEHNIAKKHGKSSDRNSGQELESHVGGLTRAIIRANATGLAAGTGVAAGGALAATLLKKKNVKPLAGHLGRLAVGLGTAYGGIKSMSNQSKEMHKKYSDEKKAAFDTLAEQGVDFDTAVEQVKQASLIGAARAGLSALKKGVMKTTGSTKVTQLAKNRTVQVGAASAAAGYVAGKMSK